MTKPLFIEDAYLRDAEANVFAVTEEGGIVLDATIFYPLGTVEPCLGRAARLRSPRP